MIYLLAHIIERGAERFPDKEAFRFGDKSLTYGQLVRQANQTARLLFESGVRRGDRVGIFLNRCLETAPAIYGIAKAGAAYVPLDPYAPPARNRAVMQDCGIRHLITSPAQRLQLQRVLAEKHPLQSIIGLKAEWPVPTVSWEEVAQLPAGTGPDVRTLEDDLAYIMYTSGSTGTPKGIMHTHRSGLSYARLSADLYGLNEEDRVGNHCSLHFDISTLGYFSAPLAGATTIIISDAHTKLPASLSKLIETERLTVWYSVPLALIQMLQNGVLDQRDCSSLRWVLFGGEPFPTKYLRALMQQWPQARFSNVYGPAEVNQCTFYHLTDPPDSDDPIPLGKIWSNTEMLILDEADRAVTPGEAGELLIRSATMMQGYWGRPDLTRQGFYQRVTIPGCEATFYRTGDLVRQRSDGNLMFLSRKDRQVKIRGFRVELDEVAAALAGHPDLEEAAVFTVRQEAEGLRIEAAVIPKPGRGADPESLRTYLQKILPVYAVPHSIHLTRDLPRTSAGKINHTELQNKATQLLNS